VYALRNPVTSTRALNYTVRSRLSTTRTLTYLMGGRATSTKQLRYGVAGRATSSRQLVYLIDGVAIEPAGRFCIAFTNQTMEWDEAVWTRIDDYPNLVTSYQIDRGRQYELDRTDTGRATVAINDTDGVFDPRNLTSPFWGKIRPLLQARIGRRNPVTGEW